MATPKKEKRKKKKKAAPAEAPKRMGRPPIIAGEVTELSVRMGDQERDAVALLRSKPGHEDVSTAEAVRRIMGEWTEWERARRERAAARGPRRAPAPRLPRASCANHP